MDYLGAQVTVLARHGDTSAHNTGQYDNTKIAVVAVVAVELKACSGDRGLLRYCYRLALLCYLLLPLATATLCCRSSIGAIDMGFFKVACKPREQSHEQSHE